MKFTRITVDPNHMGGEPCIRGLPITVETVVDLVGDGNAVAEIVARHPELNPADVLEAMQYQHHRVRAVTAILEAELADLDDDAATHRSLGSFSRERDASADDEPA